MTVTFDSSTWEKIVLGVDGFSMIRDKILSGKIEPYICEIAISLESIKKKQRLSFWDSYSPKINITKLPSSGNSIQKQIVFGPDNEKHPGLPTVQSKRLELAHKLGFKVLVMTNFGTVRSPDIPETMKINFTNTNDFWDYAERLEKCSDFIKSIGAGAYEYNKLKKEIGLLKKEIGLNQLTAEQLTKKLEKRFSKAIAEWVDGDALSAHYAYGNEIFCTQDRGSHAGSRSVFHPSNLSQVKEKFGLCVLSVDELANL